MTPLLLIAFPVAVFAGLYLLDRRSRRQRPPARVLDSASLVKNLRRGDR